MGESRRVALLAKPGEACERLRTALRDAGGDIVLEGDPARLDPQTLRAAAPETVLVALDPSVEDALEKFDDVLSDRAIDVIFDEADVAARREGWDAARWVRHLSAKLHRHDDVLPPGREPDAPINAEGVGGFEFDDISPGRVDFAERVFDAGDIPLANASTIEFDVPTDLVFEPVAATGDAEPAAMFGDLTLTDDIGALDFNAVDIAVPVELSTPRFGEDVQEFDAWMRDAGDDDANVADVESVAFDMPPVREFVPEEALPNLDSDIAPPNASPLAKGIELAMPDFGALSEMTLRASDAPAAPKLKHDLLELERRIASLSLVDEAEARTSPAAPAPPASAPIAAPVFDLSALEIAPIDDMHADGMHAAAPASVEDDARGAVLIIAGIGGPDAVRQILTALPSGFPRAVLISQRLDGGRYDRLVQQLARASAMPVHLGEIGAAIVPSHVYIVPPELGVDDTNGLHFISATSEPGTLPVDDTAILLLSGADPAFVDVALAHAAQGALVAGQSPEGCYDAAAPAALLARGGTVGTPSELVQSLLARWPARTPSP